MQNDRRSYFARPTIYFSAIAFSSIYIFVVAHTPLSVLAVAGHDDGLFIRLGQEIANGKWLGSFSQFTLMKGPGYPAFLALSHWSGLPVSIAHALFHCAAVISFTALVHHFIKSLFISSSIFLLLLWNPYSLEIFRLTREQIYYGQLLILLAATTCALFGPHGTAQRNIVAALAGGALGWFWLTREEGLWILPGICVLVALAVLGAWRERRIRQVAVALLLLFGVFAASQITFYAINWHFYDKFVGVDVKEPNFQRALGVLHSVRSGNVKPFVSVTGATRERIYAVSPSFAALSMHLDTPAGTNWPQISCQAQPVTCGEIGAGWFMWAFRDAAALAGNYSSPSRASAFFGKIADEVSMACATGALQCEPQILAEVPPWTWHQVVDNVLQRYLTAFTLVLWPTPSRRAASSSGPPDLLMTDLHFLNYPPYTPTDDGRSVLTVSGWFYKAGAAWPLIEVFAPDGLPADVEIDRNSSPDIASYFKDSMATHQRFTIRTRCSDGCTLRVQTSDAFKVERHLSDLLGSPITFTAGADQVYIDTATRATRPEYDATAAEKAATALRVLISVGYRYLFVPLLLIGVIAFMSVTLTSWPDVIWNASYALALSSWLLVFARVTLIVFIDATSFPALNESYLSPVYFLLITGAALSCAAWAQLSPGFRAHALHGAGAV